MRYRFVNVYESEKNNNKDEQQYMITFDFYPLFCTYTIIFLVICILLIVIPLFRGKYNLRSERTKNEKGEVV